jgi:hypothetical protein
VNWGLKFVLPVLRHCQNLQDLELDFDNPTSSYLDSTQDLPIYERFLASGINLPKLRKLRLSRQHPYLDILDFLTAPALRNMNLHFEIGEIYYEGDEEQRELEEAAASLEKPLFPFLQRSGCIASLRSLSIYGRTLSSDELIAVFSKLPALTHLSLTCVDTDYEMLWDAAAQPLDASTGVCSLARLESLEMKRLETISTDDLQAIGRFFKAAGRRQGSSSRHPVALIHGRLRVTRRYRYHRKASVDGDSRGCHAVETVEQRRIRGWTIKNFYL